MGLLFILFSPPLTSYGKAIPFSINGEWKLEDNNTKINKFRYFMGSLPNGTPPCNAAGHTSLMLKIGWSTGTYTNLLGVQDAPCSSYTSALNYYYAWGGYRPNEWINFGHMQVVGDINAAQVCFVFADNVHEELGAMDDFACGPIRDPDVPVVSCSFGGQVNIDHGTLPSTSVSGSTAQTQATVSCDGVTNATVTLGNSTSDMKGTLTLPGDIVSHLSVNGTSAESSGVKVTFANGINTMTVASRLTTTGKPSSGDHTGKGVIMINFQ